METLEPDFWRCGLEEVADRDHNGQDQPFHAALQGPHGGGVRLDSTFRAGLIRNKTRLMPDTQTL